MKTDRPDTVPASRTRAAFVPASASVAFALAIAIGSALPSLADTSASLAAASCATPDREALVLSSPTPEWPEYADAVGTKFSVTLGVDLAEDATVRGISVRTSSGSWWLDHEAIRVAARSTYAPAIENCSPRARTYAFVVDFAR